MENREQDWWKEIKRGGRVEKHKATPTEATIYLPNCLLDLCPLCISVPYLKIRPFLSPPPTPQKSLCIAHKMRLTFILQRKIVSYQPRPRNLVFSQVKHVLRSMWLKIYMTHDQLFPNSVFFFSIKMRSQHLSRFFLFCQVKRGLLPTWL